MKIFQSILLFAAASKLVLSADVADLGSLLIHPTEVIAPPVTTITPIKRCNDVGEFTCIENHKAIGCGSSHLWEEYVCPGGCSSDAALASCLNPAVPELASNVRRNDAPCKPKSRACDSERRFVFECGDDGHWNEGKQCNRAGACKVQGDDGLICSGHPHFYYDDNRVCERERSCELMGYWYCLAVSPTVVVRLGVFPQS